MGWHQVREKKNSGLRWHRSDLNPHFLIHPTLGVLKERGFQILTKCEVFGWSMTTYMGDDVKSAGALVSQGPAWSHGSQSLAGREPWSECENPPANRVDLVSYRLWLALFSVAWKHDGTTKMPRSNMPKVARQCCYSEKVEISALIYVWSSRHF